MHLVLAGRLGDDVERLERTLAHVIFERLLGEPRVRIDPGDDEDRQTLADAPFDEGLLRRKVEDIIFVDPRRDDQHRALEHRFGRRRVLDQLHQLVLVDHLAGGEREVLADRELRRIGLSDLQIASAGLDVLGQHVHAAHEIFRVLLQRRAHQLRIGQDEV